MTDRWQDRVGSKLVSLEEAMRPIQSGQRIAVAPYTSTPLALCRGLVEHARRAGQRDLRVVHPASGVSWTDPELVGVFELCDNYATPPNRAACHEGRMEYLPVSVWRSDETPAGFDGDFDVFLVPVSPPDRRGYSSFGSGVWMSPQMARQAKRVIAEVQTDFIRTYGANSIHIDQIDAFVMGEGAPGGAAAAAPPNAEEVAAVEAICTQVAAELVNDGDTIQVGVGTVSAALGPFLDFRNDLGVQTELITGGIAELVRKGVVTGARKSLHPYKVVASACTVLPREELEQIHENPAFELYDFGYTDDLRRLIQQQNFVAVNNALIVDLTGQVSAEAYNHRMYTGVGGQTVFMIAGAYSPGGKSISVLPSSSVPTGSQERVTRIVAALPPGTPVTVPRTFVDYVVTEHGIALLRGKTVRERASRLIEIAHPDFRAELRSEARKLYAL